MPLSTLSRAHFNTGAFSTSSDAMTATAQAAAYGLSKALTLRPIAAEAPAITSDITLTTPTTSTFPSASTFPGNTTYPGG